ncbi:MAG: DEAD/DEAH box helicase [Desulfobacterales bacterium]|jgi:ATP-dependent RNA helicase RhlB
MKKLIQRLFGKKTVQPGEHPTTPDPGKGKTESAAEAAPEKSGRSRRGRPGKRLSAGQSPDPRPPEGGPSAQKDESGPAWSIEQFQVPGSEGKVRFHDLDIPEPVMHAIHELGFRYCTPIQAEILPSTLKGMDATGRAQTGTGKTAAFLITVMTHMLRNPAAEDRKPGTPRVLVLAPTRELVLQIASEAEELGRYCPFAVVSVFGGVDLERQRKQLGRGPVDIVVATPGRLLDFQRRKDIHLQQVEILIIDEADRMLDMGFIPDVRKIVYSTPAKDSRQTLFFSATLDEAVNRLAQSWTRGAVKVEIEPEQVAVDSVDQVIYIVTQEQKFALLYNIIEKKGLDRVLVFCNRKDETRRLADLLWRFGIDCAILSGDVPQNKRTRRLSDFKSGKIRVLVATDVAGRGIHIEDMDHVVNYTLPQDPEDYVHRIGRTGRAGAVGTSISFADEDDSFQIPAIEKFIGREIGCTMPDESWLAPPKEIPGRGKKRAPRGAKRPGPKRGGSKGGRSRRTGSRGPRGRMSRGPLAKSRTQKG